jgi:hypothetical protein
MDRGFQESEVARKVSRRGDHSRLVVPQKAVALALFKRPGVDVDTPRRFPHDC